jgi:hypothetical protein
VIFARAASRRPLLALRRQRAGTSAYARGLAEDPFPEKEAVDWRTRARLLGELLTQAVTAAPLWKICYARELRVVARASISCSSASGRASARLERTLTQARSPHIGYCDGEPADKADERDCQRGWQTQRCDQRAPLP